MAASLQTTRRTDPLATSPDDVVVHSGRVLAITGGVTFLAFLDVTVVNLAFPNLARSFPRASVADLSWVITGYVIPFAALLSPAGRLADGIGRKRLLLIGVATFIAASAACAIAPSVGLLTVARVVQGAGAAVMLPASLGQVLHETPPEKRAAAIGVWGASAGMAAAVGPALGGLLVDAFNWRSVFLINLPLGLVLLAAARRQLRETRDGPRQIPGPLGTVAMVAGIALVVLGVSKGVDWGWMSAAVVGSIAFGVALSLVAVRRAFGHPVPAIDTSLWRIRTFAAANVTSLLVGASLYAWLLIGVLYVTSIWHYSELIAGLSVTPPAFTAAVASAVTGRRTGLRGQRIAVVGGALVLTGVSLWMYATLGAERQFLELWLPAGLISGAAVGAMLTGLSSAAALSVPPECFAAATGLNLTARQIGGALGIAGLAVILQSHVPVGIPAFHDVYMLCAITALVGALAGLRISERRTVQ